MGKNISKRLKHLAKVQKKASREANKLQEELRKECLHIDKHGDPLIEPLPTGDGAPLRGVCSECGQVLILDSTLLTPQSVETSVQIIKTVMAEARVQEFRGEVKFDKQLKRQLEGMDTQLLADLPSIMEAARKKKKKKKKNKGKERAKNNYDAWARGMKSKNKKKKKKKKNTRKSWMG